MRWGKSYCRSGRREVLQEQVAIVPAAMDVRRFTDYYRAYVWSDTHGLSGYPPDQYPAFEWIKSLEKRFLHYRSDPEVTPLFLIREMIQWGGSQNGVLEKFDNALGTHCLQTKLDSVLGSLRIPRDAIKSALDIPGLGLTYASKLLRFLDPERYGALDGRIRKALGKIDPSPIPKVFDGNKPNMASGYCIFTEYVESLRRELSAKSIPFPSEGSCAQQVWQAADVEMALFHWASSQEDDLAIS
jgi:hypothetical protein